jgi:hypothetical protein
MRAFALMQRADHLEAAYIRSPVYVRASAEIDAIRAALPSVGPLQYRGIGRYPFTEYPEKGPGWEGEGEVSPDPESAARALLLRFLGPDEYDIFWPRAFLPQIAQAKAVYDALIEKRRYELIEICTPPERPRDLLGFDIGYWGGGNFSILCDAAVWPIWHGPDATSLPDLAGAIRELNEHVLFPNERSAMSYLEWYKTQPWAEEVPAEFTVMAVGAGA